MTDNGDDELGRKLTKAGIPFKVRRGVLVVERRVCPDCAGSGQIVNGPLVIECTRCAMTGYAPA